MWIIFHLRIKCSIVICLFPKIKLCSPLSICLKRSGWPRIWWCGIGGFQEQVQCRFVGLVALYFFVFNYFPFLFFSSIGWLCGAGVFGLIRCQSPSPGLALPIFFNNNNNNEVIIVKGQLLQVQFFGWINISMNSVHSVSFWIWPFDELMLKWIQFTLYRFEYDRLMN